MAEISIRELYYGDDYNVALEVFKEFQENHTDKTDETIKLFLLTVKHSVLGALTLIENKDSISELQSEMEFFYGKELQ
ncbi:MAG: hypothetical protein R3Y35_12250 [Clostridia bacterium]